MVVSWTPYVVASAVAVSALGILVWKQQKKNFVKVGKIAQLFFFPVKSLRAVAVSNGKCTKLGFEVDGLLDRSFMLIDEENVLISQRTSPSLVLLTPEVNNNYLIIKGPNVEPLKVEILQSPPSNAKVIDCKVHTDCVGGVDCGDEAAAWFQEYLNKKGVRLVRFFPSLTLRKYTRQDAFMANLKKKYPAGFQDLTACHVVSQATIDDVNSKLEEKKVSVYNFRPNVLVDGCGPFDEDSWKYMKFGNEALLQNLVLTTRCILTTNDVDTGVLSQKVPLVTLRKYRIPSDPTQLKNLGPLPCVGTGCAVLSDGNVQVGEDVFAVVVEKPKMQEKFS